MNKEKLRQIMPWFLGITLMLYGFTWGLTATTEEINQVCDGNTATAAEISSVVHNNTATAAEITAVCDGNTATAAELSQLHSQGAVAADFAKLHAVSESTIAGTSYTTVTPGGEFTSGTIYLSKVGRTVTVSWSSMGHASDYSVVSSAGVIPAAYRPIAAVSNLYRQDYQTEFEISVSTSGTVTAAYYAPDTSVQSGTSSSAGSITYVSAN